MNQFATCLRRFTLPSRAASSCLGINAGTTEDVVPASFEHLHLQTTYHLIYQLCSQVPDDLKACRKPNHSRSMARLSRQTRCTLSMFRGLSHSSRAGYMLTMHHNAGRLPSCSKNSASSTRSSRSTSQSANTRSPSFSS